MMFSLHKPLPNPASICNQLSRSNSVARRTASELRFAHAGAGFPLIHDRRPMTPARNMSTIGKAMQKMSYVTAIQNGVL